MLHYRSGGVLLRPRRPGRATGDDPVADAARDVLRGMVASANEPIAGGRHKVFGNADLHVIPTTSTIASHLPRAVGAAFAIERLRQVNGNGGSDAPWPADAIVVCSFGDASVNHASATAAFNTAGWCDHTGLRLPLLFVCEDNGLGISVRSPEGWVEAALRSRPGIRYFAADGGDLGGRVRRRGRGRRPTSGGSAAPAVLHLSTVRLMGHAGADAEIGLPHAARTSTATWPATRWWRPPGCWSTPGWPRPTR